MRPFRYTKAVVATVLLTPVFGCSQASPPVARPEVPAEGQITRSKDRVDIVSKIFHVDKIYKSMTGPWSQVKVKLVESVKPEIVWITGAKVEMLNATGRERMPDEFMCHANVDIESDRHCKQFGFSKAIDGRLFTLSQGQLTVKFPEGTGIPVRSDLPLDLTTQVLNLNLKDANFDVRHHVTIDIVRDCDLKGPMVPLYEAGISSHVSLEGRPLTLDLDDDKHMLAGAGMCIPGQKAMDWDEHEDRYGRKFTGHWVVPPGRQQNATRVTSIVGLTSDTKIHAIAVHLHPYAESLELRDVTENKTVFKSKARNFPDRIGLEYTDSFASPEGVTFYRDHEYELVSVYNNTTDQAVDSMAVMYLYLFDPEFAKDQVERRLTLADSEEGMILEDEADASGHAKM